MRAASTRCSRSRRALAGDGDAITAEHVAEAAQGKTLLYDKAGDEHYGVVSRVHQEHARLAIPTPRSTG